MFSKINCIFTIQFNFLVNFNNLKYMNGHVSFDGSKLEVNLEEYYCHNIDYVTRFHRHMGEKGEIKNSFWLALYHSIPLGSNETDNFTRTVHICVYIQEHSYIFFYFSLSPFISTTTTISIKFSTYYVIWYDH